MTSNDYSDYLLESLPTAMVAAKRWLLYKLIPVEGKKPIKKPYCCDGRPREGKLDTDADNARLCTFNDAVAAFARGGYSGLGFALGLDNGAYWQGIDFDNVSEGGATDVLIKSGLPGYTERSVSGNGWHCIGYGKQFKTLGSRVGVGIEAYCTSRYFVVTGDCAGGDIEDLSDYVERELMPLHSRVSGEDANNIGGMVDIAILRDIRAALNYLALDSNDYDTWVNVGMALKTIDPETTGYGMWLEWSSSYPNFNKAECAAKWRTFNPSSLTYRSIFRWASENGWENPKYTEPVTDEWRSKLITRPGKPVKVLSRLENIALYLLNDERFKGRFRFNEFSGFFEIDGKQASDGDEYPITCMLERHFAEKISPAMVRSAIAMVANQFPYNPLTDYLSGVSWDSIARVETLFIDYFNSDDTDYCRDVARSFMVSAVARAFKPGCKVDSMVVLEGLQGIGKSTFIEVLVSGKWYAEITADIKDKDFMQNLRGKWVMDFGELAGITKADLNRVKQILSSPSDRYRKTHGHFTQDHPRCCIFFGGTNESAYLRDLTGNRRFFPVACNCNADIEKLISNRDQLWAEAVQLYRQGWRWWDVRNCEDEQDQRVAVNPLMEKITLFIDLNQYYIESDPLWLDTVRILEYLEISKQFWEREGQGIGKIMKKLGYKKVQKRIGGGKKAFPYVKID
jgi:Virulence-associated protein E/Primase C terminal 2 (PriCT-2)